MSEKERPHAQYDTSNQLYKIGSAVEFISKLFHETANPRYSHPESKRLVSLDYEFFKLPDEDFERDQN